MQLPFFILPLTLGLATAGATAGGHPTTDDHAWAPPHTGDCKYGPAQQRNPAFIKMYVLTK